MTPLEPRITKPPARGARRSGARRVRLGRNKGGRRRLRKRRGKGNCERRPSCASLRRRIRPGLRPRATCRNRHIIIPGGGLVLTTIPVRAIADRRLITIARPNGWPPWVLRAVGFRRPLGRCVRWGSEFEATSPGENGEGEPRMDGACAEESFANSGYLTKGTKDRVRICRRERRWVFK